MLHRSFLFGVFVCVEFIINGILFGSFVVATYCKPKFVVATYWMWILSYCRFTDSPPLVVVLLLTNEIWNFSICRLWMNDWSPITQPIKSYLPLRINNSSKHNSMHCIWNTNVSIVLWYHVLILLIPLRVVFLTVPTVTHLTFKT